MVNYIHNEFLKIVETIDWMDQKTRQRALDKAKNIQAKIGYSKEILDQNRVWELFKGVSSLIRQRFMIE
jgi:predicted metalloendopeptidase